jgi:hypothetical protein
MGCELEDQVIALEPLNRKTTKALVTADPMLDVDHIVSNIQVVQIGQKSGSLAFWLRSRPRYFGEQLLCCHNGKRRPLLAHKPRAKVARSDIKGRPLGKSDFPFSGVPLHGGGIMLRKECQKSPSLALVACDNKNRSLAPKCFQRAKGIGKGSPPESKT